jgi:hypothetical protein
MNEILYTENITIDYFYGNDEYRLSLFDVNGHYVNEIYLTPRQLKDLIEKGSKLEIECNDDAFN